MDEQYGYCPGRSTEMAINRVIDYVKSGEEKYTNLLFVDISGAFDDLWWPSLFKAIANIGTPQWGVPMRFSLSMRSLPTGQ